jgi:NAD(P)-dependent dehydrogenase (short-subunit alcohol dehydrogenase family)
MKLLQDKVCVVTGGAGARSIGRATAAAFAEHGARVAVLDIDGAGAEAAAAALPGSGHKGYACDVTNRQQCFDVVAAAERALGPIATVVNSAGIAEPASFVDIASDRYDAMMDVNLRGTFHVCQAAARSMIAAGSGSIINIASVAAQRGGGLFGGAHYAAAKGGVMSLTRVLARELGPKGVRANVICPSFVETDIHGGKLSKEAQTQIVASVPLGRAGQPQDIAGVCLFLASSLSAYVTGAVIDVNGGSHIH